MVLSGPIQSWPSRRLSGVKRTCPEASGWAGDDPTETLRLRRSDLFPGIQAPFQSADLIITMTPSAHGVGYEATRVSGCARRRGGSPATCGVGAAAERQDFGRISQCQCASGNESPRLGISTGLAG